MKRIPSGTSIKVTNKTLNQLLTITGLADVKLIENT